MRARRRAGGAAVVVLLLLAGCAGAGGPTETASPDGARACRSWSPADEAIAEAMPWVPHWMRPPPCPEGEPP